MRWRLLPVVVGALGICPAQTSEGLPPELLTLAKIKVHMERTLTRQPNYTCVEEIERSHRRAPRNRFELVDMLRLEVALVEGKELFGWPGSEKFGEADIEKMAPPGGAIGNGDFALFAKTVFLGRAPTFEYRGIVDMKGRPAIRYDYRVPQMLSGFLLKMTNREAVVGFHGSFWADPQTLDALRLEVIADDIPPVLGLRGASTTMEYARMRIGDTDFLLPSASEMAMTLLSGDEDRNRTRFSACRQYTGQSVLKFSEAPLTEAAAPAAAAPSRETVDIPDGLSFEVSLDAEIDASRSMVGDPITATLRENIKQNKRVVFPKGAKLSGRILRLERQSERIVIDLRFSAIDTQTSHASIAADVEERLMASAVLDQHAAGIPKRGEITLRGGQVRLARGSLLRLRTVRK